MKGANGDTSPVTPGVRSEQRERIAVRAARERIQRAFESMHGFYCRYRGAVHMQRTVLTTIR